MVDATGTGDNALLFFDAGALSYDGTGVDFLADAQRC
jgi:hypothetical protein